jgi:hypothetical protein
MKKIAPSVLLFLLIGITSHATANNFKISECNTHSHFNGSAYIFEEGGVEFSVFSDGQFDFSYTGQSNNSQVEVIFGSPNVNISFNAGHDYDLFVQYDDYGAVTQVENVPIYYDSYGRITRAGNVDIRYNNRRIVRVGSLFVNYNHYGQFINTSGFINIHNQFYVYRPWHSFYVAPFLASCIVYDYPYRRHYSPIRYSYANHRKFYQNRHRVAYQNARRSFYRPGSRVHYRNGRSAKNTSYKHNRRNTMISEYDSRSSSKTVKRKPLVSKANTERSRVSSTSNDISSTRKNISNTARRTSNTKAKPAETSRKVIRNRPSSSSKMRSVTSRSLATKRTTPNTYKTKRQTVKGKSISQASRSKSQNRNTKSRVSSSKRRGL